MINKNLIYLLGLIWITSCGTSTNENGSKSENKKKDSVTFEENSKITFDTTGFLKNCDELISHSSLGNLQGVEAGKDSIMNFYFGECFTCNETYQIIFVHKEFNKRLDEAYNVLSSEFKNGCTNDFKNFNCFAFVYPMRDPDKQKDPHAINFDFPMFIRAYERIDNDNWRFIKSRQVKNYQEYALFKFNSIYHIE